MSSRRRFQDYFSNMSTRYAQFRPSYPPELFATVARNAPGLSAAWDCATGSGQAAVGLSRHFHKVFATDASPQQIQAAMAAPNVEYRVAPAEASGLKDDTINAVTVAMALQWFDRDQFYGEVRRVCTPGGILAVWFYGPRISFSPEIDAATEPWHELLMDHWPEVYTGKLEYLHHLERADYQDALFSALAFPFQPLPIPTFDLVVRWDVSQFVGVLMTASAVERCLAAGGEERIIETLDEIEKVWGDPAEKKTGVGRLAVRIGRVD